MNIMIRLTLVLAMILFLNGCGFKDIDKRFFVVGIGIDKSEKEDKPFRVSLKLAIPPEKPGKGAKFQVLTEETDTITEAIRNIKSKVDKELDFGQTKVIVLGEDFAQKDIRIVLDWLERRRDIQKIAWMAIGRPNAEKVLNVKPPSEQIPSNTLILPFEEGGTESQFIVSQKLFQFYQKYMEKGINAILPVVEAGDGFFTIDRVGVLDKMGLQLVLSKQETSMFNIIQTGLQKSDIQIGEKENLIMISADQASADYSIRSGTNQRPYVNFNMKIRGIVEEQKSLEPITQKMLNRFEQTGAQEIEKKALSLLTKLQERNLDPIGFGLRYRSRHWNNATEWEEWQKIYPELDFRVQADIRLRATGMVK